MKLSKYEDIARVAMESDALINARFSIEIIYVSASTRGTIIGDSWAKPTTRHWLIILGRHPPSMAKPNWAENLVPGLNPWLWA